MYINFSCLICNTSNLQSGDDASKTVHHTVILFEKFAFGLNLTSYAIETFWVLLVRKVYDSGWETKSEDQLKQTIYQNIREVNFKTAKDR